MGSQGRWRSWARGVPSGLLLALLLAWPGAAGSQSAGPNSATVQGLRLSWTSDWTPTDIVLSEKDTLHITIAESDGTPDAVLRQQREALAASGELYAFAGRIGDGPVFKVERSFRQVVTGAGRLALRWDVPREYARLVPAFNVTIEVERAPTPDPDPDLDPDPTKNAIEAENLSVGGNEAAPAPQTSAPKHESGNLSASQRAGPTGGGDEETPRMGFWRTIPLLGGLALLLLAAAATLAMRRWQRRRRVERTRSLLALSPSLDLSAGECRGGSLPADGPAASLRARLEEGAIRSVEGGEDG